MKPVVLDWALAHGLPPWIVPGYGTLAGLAALVTAALVLRLTKREGGDVRGAAATLLLAYAAALGGGYVYEWLRVTPAALMTGSIEPYLHVGRAAYGGLLFAMVVAALHLRRRGASVAPFFDRIALGLGAVYALVRLGCLLEGCDYGAPTELPIGVSYPAGSLAALHHAHLGWIPGGAASLPTHPTQLYEGAVGLLGSAVALGVYLRVRRGRAPGGSAFAAWLVVYAIGRAAIEGLRADGGRGVYAGLSSAQWTSLAVGAAVLGWWLWRRRGGPVVAGEPA